MIVAVCLLVLVVVVDALHITEHVMVVDVVVVDAP